MTGEFPGGPRAPDAMRKVGAIPMVVSDQTQEAWIGMDGGFGD